MVPFLPRIADAHLDGTALAGTTGGVLLWTVFGLLGSMRSVTSLDRQFHFTFHLPFVGAAMVLGGPAAGAWVAVLSTIERRELASLPWYGILANHATIVTAAVLGGVTVMLTDGFLAASTGDAQLARFGSIILGGLVLELLATVARVAHLHDPRRDVPLCRADPGRSRTSASSR